MKDIASGDFPVYLGSFFWNELCYDGDMSWKEKYNMNVEILIIEDDAVIRKELQTLLSLNMPELSARGRI